VQQPGPFGSYTNSTVTPLITNATYFPFGGATTYTWAQGNQSVSRTYDANGQVSDLTSGALNLHFRRDAMGNIAAEGTMPGANPATESYQYDPLYRLKELDDSTGSREQSFTYNQTGDRLSATTGTQPAAAYSYQTGTHFLSNVGGLARVPDSNGNTTAMTAPNGLLVGLGYDDRNLLTAVTNAGSTIANYQYNGLGYRVWRTITSPSTGQMAAVYDPAGTGNLYGEYFATDYREYVYLNGIPVASATDAGRGAPLINYLHADHLGTLRAVTDTSGNAVYSWAWQDNALGDQPKSGAANFYSRFPGQYFDVETGLHYSVNRYYEPATGRYVESDPIGLAGGVNTYAYVGSNPLSRIDPLGLDWVIHQGTGQIQHVDANGNVTDTGTGYAGHGDGLNNPAMQGVPNIGPLPQGSYTIEPQRDNVTGSGTSLPGSMRLDPNPGTDMHGRAGFLIHGPHENDRQDSSNGCPVANRGIRNQIGQGVAGGDNQLRVVP
jgi:RHS repeat-associated protein